MSKKTDPRKKHDRGPGDSSRMKQRHSRKKRMPRFSSDLRRISMDEDGRTAAADWPAQIDELLKQVSASGVHIEAGADQRLLRFCQEVQRAASLVNLVSKADLPQLPAKHIAPSLAVLRVKNPLPGEKWIDVGTGGGFPGMAVKLSRPDVRMTLLDSSEKKVAFLKGVALVLGFPDLEIVRARVESLGEAPFMPASIARATDGEREDGEQAGDEQAGGTKAGFERKPLILEGRPVFDVILMRAVASLEKSLELVEPISSSGTVLLTFKGPGWEDEIRAAEKNMRTYGWEFEGVFSVPWAQARILRLLRT
ncbi:MAG: 16S rRNA (guanine(527)-N(7))-methyltransferase RsmG [Candidatus Eisenbacteria bacterium]|nr:16S rRNA (guanine(527)-N(7))-methyltransferase RsmG [Candidatus Eisenbacteria bacterium]